MRLARLLCLLSAWALSVSMAQQPPRGNRLGREKSPYLLQHADNPVDWFAWGPEAFEKARKEDKPIFLSIGYSTCHWCHVMERESFEDPSTAELLNEHFISIKVDREERPDVDALYMQAVMAMAGQGGWPLSVFLTPDLHPFYGGTYFPPEDRWGHPGFKSVLRGVAQSWATRRQELLQSGQEMADALRAGAEERPGGAGELSAQTLKQAFEAFSSAYDEHYGGFEPAPKFPRSHALSFLLRYWKRSGDADALKIVEHTLRAMAAGGMYDHLGGGFHRYSTDAEWRVPHFEKMLYDQALLATAYIEAYQATGAEEYARVAREIFSYVLRDMTSPEGGFFSAEDADSLPASGGHKREGAFYVWTGGELEKILGAERAELFGYVYGVRAEGNAAHDPQGELAGQNILHRSRTAKEASQKFGKPETEIEKLLAGAEKELFEARAHRPRPHLDDKVLVDWNGLMISALAFGSQALEDPHCLEPAERAARFILDRLVTQEGRLLHRWRDGEAAIPGTLEDYAFFIHGLVDLYQAAFNPLYLAQARRLTREMIRLFWDEKSGGFFLSGADAEQLLARQKELYDGAIPSGNSVAALDLLRVGRLTADPELERKAAKLMEHFAGQVEKNPSAFPQLLIALDFALGPSKEIVIAGPAADPAAREMLRAVRRRFLPNKVVLLHPTGEEGRAIEELAPFLKGLTPVPGTVFGKPTAYVCQNYACGLPTADAQKLAELLDK